MGKPKMDNLASEVSSPLVKLGSLWALIGITSWTDFASFLGAVYSMILIGEWLWKKVFKRMLKK
jgi:hypothetical protein